MEHCKTTVRVSIDSTLAAMEAFESFIEELRTALAQGGIHFEPGTDGYITEGEFEVGRVITWQPGNLVQLRWHPANWQAEETTNIAVQFEPIHDGTRVTVEHQGWGGLISNPGEVLSWFAGEVAGPFMQVTAPIELGNWLTDRQARRPAGVQARSVYRDPLYHYPNFAVILAELALTPDDYLIEIGCGGGALLKEALKSGCRAAAIDHSVDMVRLTQETNQDAIAAGQLAVQQASADHLPFPDASFSCAAVTGVLGFLPDPVAALREIRRVLRDGGRLVMLGSDPAMKGTPAAPEPMASRLHFYEDDELRQMALTAGFNTANVVRRNLEPFARKVGIPEEHLALFSGRGAPFLLARKG